MKIPKSFTVGGVEFHVKIVDRVEEDKLGQCSCAEGEIQIAKTYWGRNQCPSCMENTFCHELIHAILGTMGKEDLNEDECFVNTFAGFLTECVKTMKFNEDED